MKHYDHRKITHEVARTIAPTTDLGILERASGEAPDLEPGECWGHHSTKNRDTTLRSIRSARKERLEQSFSDQFQRRLGYALHYIQDLLAYATPEPFLQGESLLLHNRIEARLSHYVDSIAYEGITPDHLEGEREVRGFLTESIRLAEKDPESALNDPQDVLERCFRVCLSVADAVCNNERGFPEGSEAIEVMDQIPCSMRNIEEQLDDVEEALGQATSSAASLVELETSQWDSLSFIGRAIAMLQGKGLRCRRERAIRRIGRLFRVKMNNLREIENWEAEVADKLSELNETVNRDYERKRTKKQANAVWYGLHQQAYPPVAELKELIATTDEGLHQTEERRKQIQSQVEEQIAMAASVVEQRFTARG